MNLVLLMAVLASGPAEKPKLMILDLAAQSGVDKELAAAMTDAVVAEATSRGFFQTLSARDLATMLSVERQKQLLGCTEDGCFAELAGSMGARFVLSGALARVGDAYQLSLQMLDTHKALPVARSMRLAKDLGTLRAQVPYAVAEATGTPLPAPPSHLLTYSLLATGGALVLAGGVTGLYAVSQEALIQAEINGGAQNPTQLKTYPYYRQAQSQYGVERTIALSGMVAGGLLMAAGLYWNPDLGQGAKVALIPGVNGAAVAGTF